MYICDVWKFVSNIIVIVESFHLHFIGCTGTMRVVVDVAPSMDDIRF